jgi:hypothetical protein
VCIAFKEIVGQVAWGAITPEEQAGATCCHRTFEAAAYLKPKLAKSLSMFDKHSRVSTDIDARFHAAKAFVFKVRKTYAGGSGIKLLCKGHYPDLMIFSLERADLGTRQDLPTDAAIPLYMNRSALRRSQCFI